MVRRWKTSHSSHIWGVYKTQTKGARLILFAELFWLLQQWGHFRTYGINRGLSLTQNSGSIPPACCQSFYTVLRPGLFNRKMLNTFDQCQILHIRWSDLITNVAINLRTSLPKITDIIARRHTSLFGHAARLASHTPAHGVLACAVARRSERHAPTGWSRPPGRPQWTWVQQIGDGSISSLLHE